MFLEAACSSPQLAAAGQVRERMNLVVRGTGREV
jgi:hypothetical protein